VRAGRREEGPLRADLRRALSKLKGSPLRRAISCAREPGVQAVVVFRFGQWAASLPAPLRLPLGVGYFFLNGLIKILWGIEIPRQTRIGPGLYIGHFGGIVVNPSAVLGRNCTLSQGVTIGVSGSGDRMGVPVIGDDVYIAPGARVFGPIRIGNSTGTWLGGSDSARSPTVRSPARHTRSSTRYAGPWKYTR